MNTRKLIIASMAAAVLLAGCRSSRHAARTDTTVPTDVTTGASQRVVEENTQPTPKTQKEEKETKKDKKQDKKQEKKQASTDVHQKTDVEAVSAKLALTLRYGSKKMKLSGTYRLKRNDVVQINLTYQLLFVPINVGTLELTPDYLLFLDRYNKRYCRIAYTEMPSLAMSGIGFDYFQRIFWGDAEQSIIPTFEWSYGNWQPLGNGEFPGNIEFQLKMTSEAYRATFELSNITATDNWPTRTNVGSEYKSITLDAALRALMSIAK